MPKLRNESTVQAKLDMIGCGQLFDKNAILAQEQAYFAQLKAESEAANAKEVEYYKKKNGLN